MVKEQERDHDQQRKRSVELHVIQPSGTMFRLLALNSERLVKNGDAKDGKAPDDPNPDTAKHQGCYERSCKRVENSEPQGSEMSTQGRAPIGSGDSRIVS